MALIGEFGAAEQEAVGEPDFFTFYNEQFQVADRVGAMPLLRFASVAESGVEAEEMEGLAAMHDLLRDCLSEGDWSRFQRTAAVKKASAEELMEVCAAVYQAVTGRPTSRPSDSADGPLTTLVSSREPSSSEVSLSPIQSDPRVQGLLPVESAALSLVG